MMKCRPGFLPPALCWLAFDERILEEAADPCVPLAERLKFLAIFNGNLDEFCTVRLAELRRAVRMGGGPDDGSGVTPEQQLQEFSRQAERCCRRQGKLWHEELLPLLSAHGIRFLTAEEAAEARCQALFDEKVLPLLHLPAPETGAAAVGGGTVRNLALAVELTPNGGGAAHYAVLPLPEELQRWFFLENPDRHFDVVSLETLTEAALPRLYAGWQVTAVLPFRILRDQDYHFETAEPGVLPDLIRRQLLMRGEREVVRLDVADGNCPRLQKLLFQAFPIAASARRVWPLVLDTQAVAQLLPPSYAPAAELRDPAWPHLAPGWFRSDEPMFDQLARHHNLLLAVPYHSFEPLLKLLHDAAEDPAVISISQTLYRVAAHSRVLDELCLAARNGKKVTVLLELKARFDEEKNIFWAQKLAEAGVQVLFGLRHLKVHAKLLLIERRCGETEEPHGVLHLSTGNYNEDTAKVYVDYGLFTDDPALVRDARKIFAAFQQGSLPETLTLEKMTMAPLGLRDRILALIEREAAAARQGRVGRITARINNLTDPAVIAALHEAARQGVELRLAVRSICCYRPLPGEKVEIVRIIDRYLEHGRALRFCHGGEEEVYLSSADWMPRNFDRRIELLFPVTGHIADEVKTLLEFPFCDSAKGRFLAPSGVWSKRAGRPGGVPSQQAAQHFWRRAAAFAAAGALQISLYRAGDENELAELARRVAHEITAGYAPEGAALYSFCTTPEQLLGRQGTPGTLTLIARLGGDVAGALMITEFSHLNVLFTDPARRGCGIAASLLDRAAALLGKLPLAVRPSFLTVYAAPGTAAVYRRLGFSETGKEILEAGVRYTPMQKQLIHL